MCRRAGEDVCDSSPKAVKSHHKASYPAGSSSTSRATIIELVSRVQYQAGILAIRFFGSHAEYDKMDAEAG
jgi:HigB_toxin, RelE-like toxic component of a toxin-antitoxin system